VKRVLILGIIICCMTANAEPTVERNQLGFRDWLGGRSGSAFNLLDRSRLTVQHNISFGISSGSGGSIARSLYATTIGYKLSDPVSLTFLLGFQNSRYSGNMGIPADYNSFIGGFAFDYRPRKDIYLHFELLQSPRLLYMNSPYQGDVSPLLKR